MNCLLRNNFKNEEIRVTSNLATYDWAIWRCSSFCFFYSFKYFVLDHFVWRDIEQALDEEIVREIYLFST